MVSCINKGLLDSDGDNMNFFYITHSMTCVLLWDPGIDSRDTSLYTNFHILLHGLESLGIFVRMEQLVVCLRDMEGRMLLLSMLFCQFTQIASGSRIVSRDLTERHWQYGFAHLFRQVQYG